ncbi:MAG: winged helix-turn-helix domain-containing protein [Bacteroidales bacterium]|jgi:hypothetical protein|nr:winged helix-turn-helix domain-containing protein [Bacteroidales bacterium]
MRKEINPIEKQDFHAVTTEERKAISKCGITMIKSGYKKGVVVELLGVNKNTVNNYHRSWGFTPQKPKKKACEQNPVQAKKWLTEEYPIIEKRAKEENAGIWWGDKTDCKNQCNHGRSYAQKIKRLSKRVRLSNLKINTISI